MIYYEVFFYNFQICLNKIGRIRIRNSKKVVAGSIPKISHPRSTTLLLRGSFMSFFNFFFHESTHLGP